mmetsp:Transcript_53/g.105  ORF Transcript_53/g.105 Transcript_53/m.105 type:complete len:159 (+) Transcript_53:2-478(+)
MGEWKEPAPGGREAVEGLKQDHFRVHVRVPTPGNFLLKVFCNDEAGRGGFKAAVTLTVNATTAGPPGRVFPKLSPQNICLIEPLDAVLQIGATVKFAVALGPGITEVKIVNGKKWVVLEPEGTSFGATVEVAEGGVSMVCKRDGASGWVVFTKYQSKP